MKAIKTIKASFFWSKAVIANYFFSISFTYFIVEETLVAVYNHLLKSQSLKLISILFKTKNYIIKVIFMLKLAN